MTASAIGQKPGQKPAQKQTDSTASTDSTDGQATP